VNSVVANTSTSSSSVASSPVPKTPVIQKKKKEDLNTPSISQALSGNFNNEVAQKAVIPEYYARETRETDHNFTVEQLQDAWIEFAEKYSGQVHLYNTLSVKPILLDQFKIKVNLENSVQQDQIRMLKPEIIGFLCRKLNNSKIDVVIEMVQPNHEGKMFTDEQKMQAMLIKNPAFQKMKNTFNLDFNR
jgi:hypothetical protein